MLIQLSGIPIQTKLIIPLAKRSYRILPLPEGGLYINNFVIIKNYDEVITELINSDVSSLVGDVLIRRPK